MSLKDQYKCLTDINKKLRYISSAYYISLSGVILMQPLVSFIEKFAILNNSKLDDYKGIVIPPNSFLDFSKVTSKTNLISENREDCIYLENEKAPDYKISLTKCTSRNEEEFIATKLFSRLNMGSKIIQLPNMVDNINSVLDNASFNSLDEDIVIRICENQMINVSSNGKSFTMTKHLFGSLKKKDQLYYTEVPLNDVNIPNKFYILFKEVDDNMSVYTLCAYLEI